MFRLLASIIVLVGIFAGLPVQAVQISKKRSKAETASSLSSNGTQVGIASWYGGRDIGQLTANGETYRRADITAAHRFLPFNTRVRVTNLRNGKTVEVRINDRGPYIQGRIIDLTLEAAKKIDMIERGLVKVRIQVLSSKTAS